MFRAGDEIGPYQLLSKLGRGAFGVVWLAERTSRLVTTRVALKMPLDDDVDLESIREEARLWVQASGHPNVLPIIEANIYDEQIVIVSEYAPDGSLKTWLDKHGGKCPTLDSAFEMAHCILAGLGHLHARHIIHRDLKPANLLLQGQTPRLADFGISRVLKTTSVSNFVAGTPAYMAPEAFEGKRNEQTDLWSAGVILYQMLTGELPFPQADVTSLMRAVLVDEPVPIPDTLPQPLQQVLSQALSKDTARRFQSAAAMREALHWAAQSLSSRRSYVPHQEAAEDHKAPPRRQTGQDAAMPFRHEGASASQEDRRRQEEAARLQQQEAFRRQQEEAFRHQQQEEAFRFQQQQAFRQQQQRGAFQHQQAEEFRRRQEEAFRHQQQQQGHQQQYIPPPPPPPSLIGDTLRAVTLVTFICVACMFVAGCVNVARLFAFFSERELQNLSWEMFQYLVINASLKEGFFYGSLLGILVVSRRRAPVALLSGGFAGLVFAASLTLLGMPHFDILSRLFGDVPPAWLLLWMVVGAAIATGISLTRKLLKKKQP